jgi:hypothetical protein
MIAMAHDITQAITNNSSWSDLGCLFSDFLFSTAKRLLGFKSGEFELPISRWCFCSLNILYEQHIRTARLMNADLAIKICTESCAGNWGIGWNDQTLFDRPCMSYMIMSQLIIINILRICDTITLHLRWIFYLTYKIDAGHSKMIGIVHECVQEQSWGYYHSKKSKLLRNYNFFHVDHPGSEFDFDRLDPQKYLMIQPIHCQQKVNAVGFGTWI